MDGASRGWSQRAKRGTAALGLAVAIVTGVGGSALAARRYEFSGKVTGVRGDTVFLSRGLETLEFSRRASVAASRALGGLRVGDEVTVWYLLEVVRSEPVSSPGQRPGRVLPGPSPRSFDDGVPGKEQRTILDDRAFYDARNRAMPGAQAKPQS